MAAIPYTSIKDSEVKVEDSELKAKYQELKETFRTLQETRDFKTGIKGNYAVYAFQVLNQNQNTGSKFDQQKEEKQAVQNATRYLGSFTSELYKKADITDNRYIFY